MINLTYKLTLHCHIHPNNYLVVIIDEIVAIYFGET